MDAEFVSIAGESCREMLHTAGECFRQAGECLAGDTQEDEWLQFYMRGKCEEKAHPGTLTHCLPFYFKVSSLCVRPLLYNRTPNIVWLQYRLSSSKIFLSWAIFYWIPYLSMYLKVGSHGMPFMVVNCCRLKITNII